MQGKYVRGTQQHEGDAWIWDRSAPNMASLKASHGPALPESRILVLALFEEEDAPASLWTCGMKALKRQHIGSAVLKLDPSPTPQRHQVPLLSSMSAQEVLLGHLQCEF